MSRYRSAPWPTVHNPPGIPFIIGNEAAERFSFYGMRAILVVFMTQHLMSASGELDLMNEEQAKGWFHLFVSAVYFFPLLGALISDGLLGKFRTIIALSIVYCFGHLALAMDQTRLGLAIGLVLIAVGSGGIKPCVSAHLGDQFGPSNRHLLGRIYGWFYFSVNFGNRAFVAATNAPEQSLRFNADIPNRLGIGLIGKANQITFGRMWIDFRIVIFQKDSMNIKKYGPGQTGGYIDQDIPEAFFPQAIYESSDLCHPLSD